MDENNKNKKISFATIISISCIIVALSQMICLSLGLKVETSIIIDVISCVLGIFVYLGFTDFDGETENLDDITKDIKEKISSRINTKIEQGKKEENKTTNTTTKEE